MSATHNLHAPYLLSAWPWWLLEEIKFLNAQARQHSTPPLTWRTRQIDPSPRSMHEPVVVDDGGVHLGSMMTTRLQQFVVVVAAAVPPDGA
jgi:hypothetical protein